MVVYLSNSRIVNERQGGRLGPGVGKLISVCDGLRVAASSGVVLCLFLGGDSAGYLLCKQIRVLHCYIVSNLT